MEPESTTTMVMNEKSSRKKNKGSRLRKTAKEAEPEKQAKVPQQKEKANRMAESDYDIVEEPFVSGPAISKRQRQTEDSAEGSVKATSAKSVKATDGSSLRGKPPNSVKATEDSSLREKPPEIRNLPPSVVGLVRNLLWKEAQGHPGECL